MYIKNETMVTCANTHFQTHIVSKIKWGIKNWRAECTEGFFTKNSSCNMWSKLNMPWKATLSIMLLYQLLPNTFLSSSSIILNEHSERPNSYLFPKNGPPKGLSECNVKCSISDGSLNSKSILLSFGNFFHQIISIFIRHISKYCHAQVLPAA